MQNRSRAVMSQRYEKKNSLDDFPTPPWATRALLEHVIPHLASVNCYPKMSCLEPAAGRGYMSRALSDYFGSVTQSDIAAYPENPTLKQRDFLDPMTAPAAHDWVITNPPYNNADWFAHKAMLTASRGVALLCRLQFLEGSHRYKTLFEHRPPSIVAPFVERVPLVKGRVDPRQSTATAYAWFVWDLASTRVGIARIVWIPPCRKELERPEDYA